MADLQKKQGFVYINDLHYEDNLWRNELKFYKEELAILQHRLDEVIAKNTPDEVGASVESFQNRFELQRKNISDLKHEIKTREAHLAQYAQDHPIAVDHVHFKDHTALRDRMERFRELYNELKSNFNRFAIRWN